MEQAHLLLQILLSQSNTEGTSFENHIENKEICRFLNHIVGYVSHREADIDTMVTLSPPSLSSMPVLILQYGVIMTKDERDRPILRILKISLPRETQYQGSYSLLRSLLRAVWKKT